MLQVRSEKIIEVWDFSERRFRGTVVYGLDTSSKMYPDGGQKEYPLYIIDVPQESREEQKARFEGVGFVNVIFSSTGENIIAELEQEYIRLQAMEAEINKKADESLKMVDRIEDRERAAKYGADSGYDYHGPYSS